MMPPRVFFRRVDWPLFFSTMALSLFGLMMMKSFAVDSVAGGDYYFNRQILWVTISCAVFFAASWADWSFLKTNSIFLVILYGIVFMLLAFLFLGGSTIRGATSWYKVYSAQVEPVELMKLALLLVLAKYFSRRHIQIARIFHLVVSGMYVALPTALVLLQPDFGSASILMFLWIGMALIAGIKLRHLMFLAILGILLAGLAWSFFLYPYQQERIVAFLNPQSDALGGGYHTLQSMIAIGSGKIMGKGIGLGTQSRLNFLPEHETDFIFAAFAEEMGLVGVLIFFIFFGMVLWRILRMGIYAESNFEKLYTAGYALLLFFQALIHIGMNVGIFPITGLGMPFLSYGGSSLISLYLGLGILSSFSVHKKGVLLGSEMRYSEGVVGA